ncbi:N-acetylmuramoyl-L-alanine amidase [Cohnella sp.]|uniref:N-acetylmuramoyl-L-alanine amidase n=1 Tax=Cohnella sp. TaxID=1883426 RepID=UPI003567420A
MRENEFNRRVVALLDGHLRRCGFRTILVAPTDVDTPLKQRTNAANAAKADLYISVHANAVGLGELNGTRGIETFHYTSASSESRRAAAILHRHLIDGTPLPDRGVKAADFHVLRETRMPAVLVECGFMTNVSDAALLRSEEYRAECAEELARGVCEYFGEAYKEEAARTPEKEGKPLDKVTVIVDGKQIADGVIISGSTYVPLRAVGEAIGAKVGWDNKTKTATLTSK